MKLLRWLASPFNGQARLAQQRADAYDAFQRAIRLGDTRTQHETWPALAQATNQQFAASVPGNRRRSGWRGGR